MTRFRVVLVFVGAFALLGIPALQTSATATSATAPTVVTCGQVITVSTTLAGDVGPCPGNGIIVRADHITLNLGGHKLFGVGDESDDRVGVRMPRTTASTVTNGEIAGFSTGVYINGAPVAPGPFVGGSNVLSKLNIHDNYAPPQTGNFGDAVFISNSGYNRVTRSTMAHNGYFDAVFLQGGAETRDNRIDYNVIKDNNKTFPGQFCVGPEMGVNLGYGTGGQTIRTTIDHNVITGSGFEGVGAQYLGYPLNTLYNTITNNTITNTGICPDGTPVLPPGYDLENFYAGLAIGNCNPPPGTHPPPFDQARNQLVANNTVRHNAGSGIFASGCNNTFLNNTAINNYVADGGTPTSPNLEFGTGDIVDYFCNSGDIWRGNIFGVAWVSDRCPNVIFNPTNYHVGPGTGCYQNCPGWQPPASGGASVQQASTAPTSKSQTTLPPPPNRHAPPD